MSLTRITLMRHGETDWNVKGVWQGHAPIPLNNKGYQQAQEAAPHLKDAGIQRIISSDLLRTRQTAEAVNAVLELPLSFDARWREIDLGNWQGLTNAEIRTWDTEAWAAFQAAGYQERHFPDGESNAQHQARIAAGMQAVIDTYPGEHVLVVTHGGSVRCAVYAVREEVIHLSGNCSVTRFTYDNTANNWSIQGIAEDAASVSW